MSLLRLENVSYSYPGYSESALNGVSLSFKRGTCTGLIGANGSGKSTLLRHLNGLLRPTAGRVLLNGEDVRSTSVGRLARQVGLVFQDADAQLFSGTVQEEVRLGPRSIGLPASQREDQAARALAAVGLAGHERTNPYDLSRSQRKLLALACVLAMQPSLMALDEPLAGQDAEGAERVCSVIRRARDEGRCIALVSHDIDVVAELADRVCVLERGRMLLDGPPEQVFARESWPLLATAGIDPPAAAVLGEELGLGSTPNEAALLRRLHERRPGA